MSGPNFNAQMNEISNSFSAHLEEITTIFNVEFGDFITLYRGVVRVWIGNGTNGEDGVLYAEMIDGVIKNLGPVTGYYYAKHAGFQGTFVEWVQLLLDSTVNAQNAAQSASEALASEQAAASSEAAAAASEVSAEKWATGGTGATYSSGKSAKEQADRAAMWAAGTSSGNGSATNNAKYWSDLAQVAKNTAVSAKDTAVASEAVAVAKASDSEAWAVGQRDGSDVPSTDQTYQNNSKYYAEIAVAGRRWIAYNWDDDPTRAFEVGEFVTKDDTIYMFIAPHTANTPWSLSEVEVTNLGALLKDLQDNVVLVQQEEPTSENNKIWLKPSNVEVLVPTLEEFNGLANAKINKPSVEGTAGQVLSTNGDGTTQWTNAGSPTDQQIEDAVSDWLDDHPEATTTIQDGSITKSKLNSTLASELDFKAPAIVDEATDYVHHNVDRVTFQGNSYAFGNARYADRVNHIANLSGNATVVRNVTITKYRNIVTLNGTNSSSSTDLTFAQCDVDMPAGEYIYKIEPYIGQSTMDGGKKMYLYLWYDGNSTDTSDLTVSLSGVKDVPVSTTFTIANHVYKIIVGVGLRGETIYNDYRIFYSLFKSDVTIVDTGETVANGSTLAVDLASSASVVDTMMHISGVTAIIDTKTYIDNKTPNVNFVCFRPEDYGAVGDGNTDDSIAVQACINAAQAASYSVAKAVRGYGTYKISVGIVFDCRELDVYLNKIIYTGNDAAVTISAQYSNFEFQSIRAFAGGSAAAGIRCYQSASSLFYHNKIKCGFIRSNGNTVEFKKANDVTVNSMMYNSFYFTYQRSDNANIIEIDSISCNENDFHGKLVQALNGWFLYFTPGSNGIFRFYDYCLENYVQNGTNGSAAFYNCRFAEMQNLQTISDHTNGFIFAWENMAPWGVVERSTGGLNITAINVDNAYSWQDTLGAIKDEYDNGVTSADEPWMKHIMAAAGITPFFAEIDHISCVANAHMTTHGGVSMIQEGKVTVYYNNIAFKPYSEVYKKLDDNMTILLSDTNDWNYVTPTVFDIDSTSVDINLDASYCCLAIDKFDVIQHQGKEAVVYDKLGNKIFDGTGLGAGVYHFKCSIVPYGYHELYITMTDGTIKYCPSGIAKNIYSGYNEKWIITKEEVIET